MKLSDIVWGGDHNIEVKLEHKITDLKAGDLIEIKYSYEDQIFELFYENQSTKIDTINKAGKNELDLLLYDGVQQLTTVLEIKDLTCLIKIRLFSGSFEIAPLTKMGIAVKDSIVNVLPEKAKENSIEFLKEEFVFKDSKTGKSIVFVRGFGNSKRNDFALISRRHSLNVLRDGDTFITDKYITHDASYLDRNAIYLLKGNIEFVNSTKDAKVSAELSQNMDKIKNSGKYFDIWDAYLTLEKISLLKHARDVGVLKYKSFTCQTKPEGYEYIFRIEDTDLPSFAIDDYIDVSEKDEISDEKTTSDKVLKIKSIKVGKFCKMSDTECILLDTDSACQNTRIPQEGYLFSSIRGDKIRMDRCENAKEKIANNWADIDHLKQIIEDGTVLKTSIIKEEKALTQALLTLPQFKKKKFNKEQEIAIGNAINTPDISLILGPPGSGKTTVIKAIVARFGQIYRKYNPKETPSILITSFQHEAVDNAAKEMQNDGLPPARTGGKRVGNVSAYISNWKAKKVSELTEKLDQNVVTKDDALDGLRGQIFSWKEKGRDLKEGIELLRTQINSNEVINLSEDILNESRKLISQYESNGKKIVIQSMEEEEQENRNKLILQQRIEKEAFADDGLRWAKKLRMAIEDEALFNVTDISPLEDVINSQGNDTEVFKRYVVFVNDLRDKYYREKETEVERIDIPHQLEELLKRISGQLDEKKIKNLNDSMQAETLILRRFLDLIQDDAEIQNIVNRYSSINAATCQQSLDLRNTDKHYDLVIVDEAARANPLDLMIPMSMGKKVILVGDHKQLPHMLDPDVVKEYRQSGNVDDMGILKESLFERMFNALEKSNAEKRTVRLTKQYRMNPVISNFASKCFYEETPTDKGLDSSEVDVEEKTANLVLDGNALYDNKPLAFFNMDISTFDPEKNGKSKSREDEVIFILKEVVKVLKADSSKSIGIITFYSKQRELFDELKSSYLNSEQNEHVEVGTIDAFQGKEFDIVFLSCVRANSLPVDDLHKKIGHSNDRNRLCVSFTRARQLLVTVGDEETMSCVPEMKKLIELCKGEDGYYETVKK